MTQPTQDQSAPRLYPVSLMLLYPEGQKLTRGSVVLKNGPKYYFDYYTLRKGEDETASVLHSAVSSILRQGAGRPVRYMVSTVNRQDYKKVRGIMDEVMQSLNLKDVEYGSSHMPTDILRAAAHYARQVVEWRDMNHSSHAYVATLGTGTSNYTAVVNVSSRSMRVTELNTKGSDPVAANINAIRDLMVNRTDGIAIWSSIEQVNALLQRQQVSFSKEAGAVASELVAYVKARELHLSYNAMAHPQLTQMAGLLCIQQYQNYLRDMLRKADEPAPKTRR